MKLILSETVYNKIIKEEKTYFIGTGLKNGFYTLRIFDSETDSSYYITTLATDKEKAKAKAKQLTGQDLQIDFDLSEWGVNYEPEINCDIMPIGREHKYKPLTEVPEGYLFWFYFNISDKKFDCVKRSIETLIPEKIASETQRRYNIELDNQKKTEELQTLKSKYKPLEIGKKYQMELFFNGQSYFDDFLIFSNRQDVTVIINADIKDMGYGPTFQWEGSGGWRKLKRHEKYNVEFEVSSVDNQNKKYQADRDLSNIPVNNLKYLNVLKTVKGVDKKGALEITSVQRFKYGLMYFLTDGENQYFSKFKEIPTNLFIDKSDSDVEQNKKFNEYERLLKDKGYGVFGTNKKGFVLVLPYNEGIKINGDYEVKENTFNYKGINYVEVKFKNPTIHINF